MAKYRLSFDVDLVGLETPTMPVPQVTPYPIPNKQPQATPMQVPQATPAPTPQTVPGYYPEWSGYAPVPQYYVTPAPQTIVGGYGPVQQPQALPTPTYTSWGGYAPVTPEQVGQYTPTPGYVTPPPMLEQSEPMLVPGKIDEQAEHALTYMRTYAAEMQRLEQSGVEPAEVVDKAKHKAQLEYEKAKVEEEIEKLKEKVSKEK